MKVEQVYKKDEDAMSVLESHMKPWTFALHFHNMVARGNTKFKIHPNQPLYKLFQRHCPLTFKNEVEGHEGEVWLPTSAR